MSISDMFPVFFLYKSPNRASCYAKSFSHSGHFAIFIMKMSPAPFCLFISKFCSSGIFSACSSFLHCINCIVRTISNPKMLRINTQPIIRKWFAVMKNPFSFRYNAIMNNPRNPMSLIRKIPLTRINMAVARGRFSANPYPTMGRFFNKVPECNFYRDAVRLAHAFHASFAVIVGEFLSAIKTLTHKRIIVCVH